MTTSSTSGVYDGLTRVEFGQASGSFTTNDDYMGIGAYIWVPDVLEADSMITLEVQFDYYTTTASEVAKGEILGQYATFVSETLDNFTLACATKVGSFESDVANYHGTGTFDSASNDVIG